MKVISIILLQLLALSLYACGNAPNSCVDVCIPRSAFGPINNQHGRPGKRGPKGDIGPVGPTGPISECSCEIQDEIEELKRMKDEMRDLIDRMKGFIPDENKIALCGLGLEKTDVIPDSAFTASSTHAPNKAGTRYSAYNARINYAGRPGETSAWLMSTPYRQNEYVQVDLGTVRQIKGIVTGDVNWKVWVSSFKIEFGATLTEMQFMKLYYLDIEFPSHQPHIGNYFNKFPYIIHARYVRVYPWTWQGEPWIKFELLSC